MIIGIPMNLLTRDPRTNPASYIFKQDGEMLTRPGLRVISGSLMLILILGLSNQIKPHLFLLANMTICDIFLLSNGFLVIQTLTRPNWTVTPANETLMNLICKDWGKTPA